MPKAVLIYTLPDELSEFNLAAKGGKWYSAAWEYDRWLRAQLKWENLSKEKLEALLEAGKKLREVMDQNGVSFDDAE